MPVPDKRLPLKEEQIPNLKNLLIKSTRHGDSEETKGDTEKDTIREVLEILKQKLKKNLMKIPSVYTFAQESSHMQQ